MSEPRPSMVEVGIGRKSISHLGRKRDRILGEVRRRIDAGEDPGSSWVRGKLDQVHRLNNQIEQDKETKHASGGRVISWDENGRAEEEWLK